MSCRDSDVRARDSDAYLCDSDEICVTRMRICLTRISGSESSRDPVGSDYESAVSAVYGHVTRGHVICIDRPRAQMVTHACDWAVLNSWTRFATFPPARFDRLFPELRFDHFSRSPI